MREHAKKLEIQSHRLDRNSKASKQAPIDVILQRYSERNIQRYAPEEELLQGKQGGLPTMQLQGVDLNDNEGLEKEVDEIKMKCINKTVTSSINEKKLPLKIESTTQPTKIIQGLFFEIEDKKITPDHIVTILMRNSNWEQLCQNYPNILIFIYQYPKKLRFFDESFIQHYFYAGDFIPEYLKFGEESRENQMDIMKIKKIELKSQKDEELKKLHLDIVQSHSRKDLHSNYRITGVNSDFLYLGWGGVMLLQKVGRQYYLVKHAISDNNSYTEGIIEGRWSQPYFIQNVESVVTDGVSSCTIIVVTNNDNSLISIMHLDCKVPIPPGYILPGMNTAFVSKIEGGEDEAKKVKALMLYGVEKVKIYNRGKATTYPATSHEAIGISLSKASPELIFLSGSSDTPRLFKKTYQRKYLKFLDTYCKKYEFYYEELTKQIKHANFASYVSKQENKGEAVKIIFNGLLTICNNLSRLNASSNFTLCEKSFDSLYTYFKCELSNLLKLYVKDDKIIDKYILEFQKTIAALEELKNCFMKFQEEVAEKFSAVPWIIDEVKIPIYYDDIFNIVCSISKPIAAKESLADLSEFESQMSVRHQGTQLYGSGGKVSIIDVF